MKTIGIIGAMREEIETIKSKMEIVSVKNIVDVEFYMGSLFGKTVVLTRSGMGKVNAAVCTQVLIDLYAVDYIVNAGVAGALSRELTIGDVVISSDVCQHDLNMSALGLEQGAIPGLGTSFFPADEELIRLGNEAALKLNIIVYTGRIASGDFFIADKDRKNRIRQSFKALCVDMESAAVGQACHLNKIPFVSVRAISDKADAVADASFDKFVPLAAKKSSEITEGIIKLL